MRAATCGFRGRTVSSDLPFNACFTVAISSSRLMAFLEESPAAFVPARNQGLLLWVPMSPRLKYRE